MNAFILTWFQEMPHTQAAEEDSIKTVKKSQALWSCNHFKVMNEGDNHPAWPRSYTSSESALTVFLGKISHIVKQFTVVFFVLVPTQSSELFTPELPEPPHQIHSGVWIL